MSKTVWDQRVESTAVITVLEIGRFSVKLQMVMNGVVSVRTMHRDESLSVALKLDSSFNQG